MAVELEREIWCLWRGTKATLSRCPHSCTEQILKVSFWPKHSVIPWSKKDTEYLWFFFSIRKNQVPFSVSKSLPENHKITVPETCLDKLSDLEKMEFCIQAARPGENIFESEQNIFWILQIVVKKRAEVSAGLSFQSKGFQYFRKNMMAKVKNTATWIVCSKLPCLEWKTMISAILFFPLVLKHNTKSIFEKNTLLHLQKT